MLENESFHNLSFTLRSNYISFFFFKKAIKLEYREDVVGRRSMWPGHDMKYKMLL